jgi:hypothetical protein
MDMNYHKILTISYYIGMFLFLSGTVLTLMANPFGAYLMMAGVLPIIAVRAYNRWHSSTRNLRIHSILFISSLLLAAAAVLALIGYNYWILAVFIAAMFDGYTSFRRLS